jgi:hypothetical protein
LNIHASKRAKAQFENDEKFNKVINGIQKTFTLQDSRLDPVGLPDGRSCRVCVKHRGSRRVSARSLPHRSTGMYEDQQ